MFVRYLLLCLCSSFIAGCAGLYDAQPPAPVFDGPTIVKSKPVRTAKPANKMPDKAAETVITEPLRESKIEQSETIEFQPELSASGMDDFSTGENNQQSFLPETEITDHSLTLPESAPPPETLTPFEPLEISAPLSPAVNSLMLAANRNTDSGNLDVASATIERAIRIEPRNANLFYQLALIRIKQSKPRLAEDLARKSALLAANDMTLKKHSWLLIAHARELQRNFNGAREARTKAERLY